MVANAGSKRKVFAAKQSVTNGNVGNLMKAKNDFDKKGRAIKIFGKTITSHAIELKMGGSMK